VKLASSVAQAKSAQPAVVLLSGGLDSTTVLAIAQSEGFAVHALTFRYGQRHSVEVDAAKRIARDAGVLSHHLAMAEVVEAADIFIGVNALDYSGYPDCRPEYIEAFERMANLATRAGVEGRTHLTIRTPLISLSKAAIITLGTSLGVDYAATTSCYDPGDHGEACGRCDACQLRLKGFSEAGLADPIDYLLRTRASGVAP
jgi:7-cyano-7-deazaguanine synthase